MVPLMDYDILDNMLHWFLYNYNYYIKNSNTTYYFRLRMFDGHNYTNYKNIEQKIDIEPLADQSMLTNITSDTVLGADMTYFCDYSCILDKNANLLVEKGVKIKIYKDAKIMFLGNVIFAGVDNDKIYIMPNNANAQPGDMGFIYFYQNDNVELNNVDVGYGGYISSIGKAGDMIQVDGVKSFVVNNSNFHDTYLAVGANMNIVNSNVKITGSKFFNSIFGFSISQSTGEISNNEFYNNHIQHQHY